MKSTDFLGSRKKRVCTNRKYYVKNFLNILIRCRYQDKAIEEAKRDLAECLLKEF